MENIIIVKGAGDIASGVIQSLSKAGFKVLATEIAEPMAVRRTVSFSEAVYKDIVTVEGITAEKANDLDEIKDIFSRKNIPIIVDPDLDILEKITPMVLIDATISKKSRSIVSPKYRTIGLGPGIVAREGADIVIETNRGHNLGRIIYKGEAQPNTGIPGEVAGESINRVLYAPESGVFKSEYNIGDKLQKDQVVGYINNKKIISKISGVIRGLIHNNTYIKKGVKVGDIDPRLEVDYLTISDKARSIGNSTLLGVIELLNQKGFPKNCWHNGLSKVL